MTRSSVRTPLRLEVLTVTFVLPNVVVVPMNVMPIIIMPIVFIVFIVVVLSFLYRKAEAIYIIRYISRGPPSGVKHCLYFSSAKLRLFSFLRKLFLLCLKGSFPTGSGENPAPSLSLHQNSLTLSLLRFSNFLARKLGGMKKNT